MNTIHQYQYQGVLVPRLTKNFTENHSFECQLDLTGKQNQSHQQTVISCEILKQKRPLGYYSIVRIASVRYVQAEDCNTRLHETLST